MKNVLVDAKNNIVEKIKAIKPNEKLIENKPANSHEVS